LITIAKEKQAIKNHPRNKKRRMDVGQHLGKKSRPSTPRKTTSSKAPRFHMEGKKAVRASKKHDTLGGEKNLTNQFRSRNKQYSTKDKEPRGRVY